jgi:hypothetical protein
MVGFITVNGRMVNRMDTVFLLVLEVISNMENGRKGIGNSG